MGRTFWFASRIAGNLQLMGLVNLLFAPLVAMLLFGDLYNSRMCNALHAMPVRRETLFLTNVVSGLLFSMIPTAVMALLSVPLLNATVVDKRVADRAFVVRRHQPAIHHLLRRGDFQRVLHRKPLCHGGGVRGAERRRVYPLLYYQYPLHAHALRRGHAGQVGKPADARGGV